MGLGLVVVGSLIELVTESVLGGAGTEGGVSGWARVEYKKGRCLPSGDIDITVLRNLLVGLLAGTGGDRLDGLSNVVDGLLGGLHCESSCWCWWFDCVVVVVKLSSCEEA